LLGRISAFAVAFAAIVVACGGTSPPVPEDTTVTTTLSADQVDAASPASPSAPATEPDAASPVPSAPTTPASPVEDASAPTPTPPQSCTTDNDCVGADLCVANVCKQACRSHYDCASDFCNFDNNGHCFNEHGCNPPPENTMCPMICWGYCDANPDAG
jgi:hypothetical protein